MSGPTPRTRRRANAMQQLHALQQLAIARGGRCLSTDYVNSATPLLWQCANGHRWSAIPTSVKNKGSWCRQCFCDRRRDTLEDMQRTATERGGRCLSTRYVNSSSPLEWECAQGHRWQAIPERINRGDWCAQCHFDRKRDTLEAMQQLAAERGGRCLSTAYISSQTPLQWACAQGHRWQAVPASVKRGTWCRACAAARLRDTLATMQQLAAEHGGRCLSKRYKNERIPLLWQCAQGHRWKATPMGLKQLGSWCRQCFFESRRDTLENMQQLAAQQGGRCLSSHYVNSQTPLLWQCAQGHQWRSQPAKVKQGYWCGLCVDNAAMQQLAARRGGLCLSTHYVDNDTALQWQCKQGHRWRATPAQIKQGVWCYPCRVDQRQRAMLAQLQDIAAARGGSCLSEHYVDMKTHLHWQCHRGHTWRTMPAVIKSGSWCPQCAILVRAKHQQKRRKYLADRPPADGR
ncbi:hypothetical protein EO087_05810 [Dyella sp. M7H15-1]|uniref:hypothetical protein n=1 Tax=Dyella sp. M7H15-1 TaxID=2501295 RepID=UPI0010051FA0|nr:hypothetical protein [Dyella sp. M7H15-1]QAU23561.1 hypothetical protein EO087_05810 [Dyella sp. M7H15-1]